MTTTPMPIPDGSVVITPNQQYAELQALRLSVTESMGSLTAAVTALTENVSKQAGDERRTLDDHETRIRSVERKVWMAAGFAAAIGGVGGGLLSRMLGG